MKRFHRLVLFAMACVLWQSLAMGAYAASGGVLLGFGSDYVGPDGSTYVHRGVDVAARPGDEFASPVDGTVTFAGKVPGPHGGSVLAVSIDSAKGLVSILPLGRLDVAKGEKVSAGQSVGTVASGGDASSDAPHVHVGLRNGSLYLDPTSLLMVPVAPQTPETQPSPATDPQTAPSPSTPVAAPVAAPSPASAPVVSPAPGATVNSGAASTVNAKQTAPSSSAAALSSLGSGVSLAPSSASASKSTLQSAAQAPTIDTGPVVDAAPVGATQIGVSVVEAESSSDRSALAQERHTAPSTTLWSGWSASMSASAAGLMQDLPRKVAIAAAALTMAIASSVYVLGRRAFDRRLSSGSPVSDRLGIMLQQLRAGDTLRGLTPAPGTLPSQSRGRSAQRR